MLADQDRGEALFHQLLAGPATVSTLVSSAPAIWLSLHPSPALDVSAFNRIRALISSRAECLPVRINSCRCQRSSPVSFTTYFFTLYLFGSHRSPPVIGPRAMNFANQTHDQ